VTRYQPSLPSSEPANRRSDQADNRPELDVGQLFGGPDVSPGAHFFSRVRKCGRARSAARLLLRKWSEPVSDHRRSHLADHLFAILYGDSLHRPRWHVRHVAENQCTGNLAYSTIGTQGVDPRAVMRLRLRSARGRIKRSASESPVTFSTRRSRSLSTHAYDQAPGALPCHRLVTELGRTMRPWSALRFRRPLHRNVCVLWRPSWTAPISLLIRWSGVRILPGAHPGGW
jgi:hypothetical protein